MANNTNMGGQGFIPDEYMGGIIQEPFELEQEDLDALNGDEDEGESEDRSLEKPADKVDSQKGNKTKGKSKKVGEDDEDIPEGEIVLEPEGEETVTQKGNKADDDEDDFKLFVDYVSDELEEGTEELSKDELFDKVKQKAAKEAREADKAEIEKLFVDLDKKLEGRLAHVLNGGDLKDFDSAAYVSPFANLKAEDIDDKNAEKVLRYNLELKGMDKEEIDELVEDYKDVDKLVEKAKAALPRVLKAEAKRKEQIEKSIQQKEAEKVKAAKEFASKQATTLDSIKEYAGVNITKKLKESVEKNLTEAKAYNKIMGDWAKYSVALSILDELGVLDGDASTIEKRVSNKAAKKIRVSSKGTGRGVSGHMRESGDDVASLVDLAMSFGREAK